MLQTKEDDTLHEGILIMIVPLLLLIFAWTSVTYWISPRAAERQMRERYALLKHLSERPAESVQLVLEQLRQDDAREEERSAPRLPPRGAASSKAGSSCWRSGPRWRCFSTTLRPGSALWMIGLMPAMIGVVLAVSTWLEQPKGER